MRAVRLTLPFVLLAMAGPRVAPLRAQTNVRTQHFDADPQWDSHNNRLARERPAANVTQDFGYDASAKRIGGRITPAAEPAFYGTIIPDHTLDQPLSASGTMIVPEGGGNTLIGFFNPATVNEWRTPNTLALRINGRGETFHVHVEYCTSRWRAGGEFFGEKDAKSGRKDKRGFASGDQPYAWSIAYDPTAHNGAGGIRARFDGEELTFPLDPGHKSDGATFNRFGILNVLKHFDGAGRLWIDDVSVNGGRVEPFDADPKWDARDNRRTYETRNVRPLFDFGFTPTNHAGGAAPGEIGGTFFRGDERYPDRMAYYADRVGDLTLEQPLVASGKIALRRGVTDSTTLFGFFHHEGSLRHGEDQRSATPGGFVGVAIEGPSSEGFLVYPVYSTDRKGEGSSGNRGVNPPHILPDGTTHEWTLRYTPNADNGGGRISVTLDRKSVALEVTAEHRAMGARFNRFGLVTPIIDGNGQEVYLDDLTYTVRPVSRR